jgi:hypothetical protein
MNNSDLMSLLVSISWSEEIKPKDLPIENPWKECIPGYSEITPIYPPNQHFDPNPASNSPIACPDSSSLLAIVVKLPSILQPSALFSMPL